MEKDEKKKGAMLDEAFLQNLMQNEQVEQIRRRRGVSDIDGVLSVCHYGSRDQI